MNKLLGLTAGLTLALATPAPASAAEELKYTFTFAGRINSLSGYSDTPITTIRLGDRAEFTMVFTGPKSLLFAQGTPGTNAWYNLPSVSTVRLGEFFTSWAGDLGGVSVTDGANGAADQIAVNDYRIAYEGTPVPYTPAGRVGNLVSLSAQFTDVSGAALSSSAFSQLDRLGSLPRGRATFTADSFPPGEGGGTIAVGVALDSFTFSVPEPATWAMMMLGFGGVGFAMRRKQKVTARIRFA